MSDHYFTCPKCGGHYFGRIIKRGPDGELIFTNLLQCHGKSSESKTKADDCMEIVEWPDKEQADD